jgi:hypothetical protein
MLVSKFDFKKILHAVQSNLNTTAWKKFERLVAAIHHAETQGATVQRNDIINGREFDVTLRFKMGLHEYLTVIECKDFTGKVPVEKIDAFVTKARDVNADKAIFVSSSGYQSGCLSVAARHGVRLLTLDEKVDVDIEQLAAQIVPALNIFNVRFLLQNGHEYVLEDEGGRLAYLMNNINLHSSGRKITPNAFLNAWRPDYTQLQTETEYEQVLAFPLGAVAKIPFEGDLTPEKIKFSYKLTKAFIPKAPTLDTHLLENFGTSYELRDEHGTLVQTIASTDIHRSMGFDTKLEAGKFYCIPSLYNYYYCEKIDDTLARLILVESYQFGMLFQATIQQETKYSGYYVEVTDKKRLERLEKMLEGYRSTKWPPKPN